MASKSSSFRVSRLIGGKCGGTCSEFGSMGVMGTEREARGAGDGREDSVVRVGDGQHELDAEWKPESRMSS